MFGHTFYHGTIRRYVVLFGTLFNDIYLNRPDTTHNQIKSVKVPIAYGPREKVLARLTADPDLNRPTAISLPRISFEMTDIQYAPERKMNTIGKRYKKYGEDADIMMYQYNPVPYNINFSMSIIVKNTDDGTRIIEQILPFFTPEWTATVQLIPDMDINMDIPIILNDVRVSDTYEGDFETRRALTWDLTFTLKGYLFGPIRKGGIIKFANSNIFSTLTSNTQLSNINITPGLLANGEPTTNATLSISQALIYPDDDFGYIITKTNINE
jgi:hypothetical protein